MVLHERLSWGCGRFRSDITAHVSGPVGPSVCITRCYRQSPGVRKYGLKDNIKVLVFVTALNLSIYNGTVEARKLAHDCPRIANKGNRENQHTSSYIDVATSWSLM